MPVKPSRYGFNTGIFCIEFEIRRIANHKIERIVSCLTWTKQGGLLVWQTGEDKVFLKHLPVKSYSVFCCLLTGKFKDLFAQLGKLFVCFVCTDRNFERIFFGN